MRWFKNRRRKQQQPHRIPGQTMWELTNHLFNDDDLGWEEKYEIMRELRRMRRHR